MTPDQPQPMGREALREITVRERGALDALVQSLTPGEMTDQRLPSGHSVKDLLAHVSAWERRVVTAVETWMGGETPAWPEAGATMADVDRLNERDFAASAAAPLADVSAESVRTHGAS